MFDHTESLTGVFRIIFVGLLVAGSLALFWAMIISMKQPLPTVTFAASQSTGSSGPLDATSAAATDPNAVTGGMSLLAQKTGKFMSATADTTNEVADTVVSTTTAAGQTVANTTVTASKNVGQATQQGVAAAIISHDKVSSYTGHVAGNGLAFIAHMPVRLVSSISDTHIVAAITRPADVEHADVPIIDPNSAELAQAKKDFPALAPEEQAQPAQPAKTAPATVAWPIHGTTTTQFGVPELPYQAVHTGLDISDGTRPGTTPVMAFRAGTVVTVSSEGGLGNHVIVDHGNGLTSVYGHLNSIAVHEGQTVDTSTVLGMEGTTGVSTGTHLHFEIRVNGQAADPHQFITGQP